MEQTQTQGRGQGGVRGAGDKGDGQQHTYSDRGEGVRILFSALKVCLIILTNKINFNK
jgi:hypothetical protein